MCLAPAIILSGDRALGCRMASKAELLEWKERIDASLKDCVDFWLKHSLDREHGGYFNCLDRSSGQLDSHEYILHLR